MLPGFLDYLSKHVSRFLFALSCSVPWFMYVYFYMWFSCCACSVQSRYSSPPHMTVRCRDRRTLWLAVLLCVFTGVSSQQHSVTTVLCCSGNVSWTELLTWRMLHCATCHGTSLFHALLPPVPSYGAGSTTQRSVSTATGGGLLWKVLWSHMGKWVVGAGDGAPEMSRDKVSGDVNKK